MHYNVWCENPPHWCFYFFLVAEYLVAEIQIPLILNVNGFL